MLKCFAAALLLSGSAALADGHSAFSGSWSGIGHQGGDTWQVELQVAPGAARVDYPDIPCGGVWALAPGNQSGVEWLTYGHALCLDGLTVRLSLDKGALVVRWVEANGTEIANAALAPAGGAPDSSGKKQK